MRFSVVLPILGSTADLAEAVTEYDAGLNALGQSYEILLVPGPAQTAACHNLSAGRDWLVICDSGAAGWGSAVRRGLAKAAGDILCYANWERTTSSVLLKMLGYANSSPELVLRANRRTRDTRRQRLGSLLFNLECRALLGTTAWDVNGTPKVFSRYLAKLFELSRDDDLLDAEFALVCENEGYPVAEIPIDAQARKGHQTPPDYRAACRMYIGVVRLRRRRGLN